MSKKSKIPLNDPEVSFPKSKKNIGQRPSTNTRGDIKSQQTDRINPNSGPMKRSEKKKF